jgi:hypothetical protein
MLLLMPKMNFFDGVEKFCRNKNLVMRVQCESRFLSKEATHKKKVKKKIYIPIMALWLALCG